jgi:opacity protein-like surface antigen
MKNILLAVSLTALTTTTFAADLKPYIEGSVGHFDSKDSKSTDGTVVVKTDNDTNYGIELGLRNVGLEGLRLGLSDNYVNGQKVKDSTSTVNSNIILANVYYDIKTSTPFTPYVGFGLGGYKASVAKDAEFMWALNAGVDYNFTSNVYVGVKARYFMGSDFVAADSGKTYKDIDSYTVGAALGYNF